MVKKAQSVVGTFLSAIGGGILGRLTNIVSDVTDRVQEKVYETLARLIRELITAVFAVIGTVFVLLGAVHFLNEKLVSSMGASYMLVGLAVLVLVLLYRSAKVQNRR